MRYFISERFCMKSPNIAVSFLFSLALHAIIAGCIITLYTHKERKSPEHLVVQIEGEISKNQLEEKRMQEPPPPPKPKPQPKPLPPLSETKSEKQAEEVINEEVKNTEPDIAKNDIDQTAQRIDEKEDEANEIRKYLTALKKRLSSNIKYPLEAKKKGYVGIPVVGFSILEDGSAQEIHIVKSSGYAILDESALEAVRKSSPFDKPPRPLHDVSVDIFFKKE
jgi:protein TonB